MQEAVAAIQRVTVLMTDISAATAEQSSGMGQIGEAVQHLDQTTQQNASLVEELSAAQPAGPGPGSGADDRGVHAAAR